jgi:flagellar hook-basal body complex protein FliE
VAIAPITPAAIRSIPEVGAAAATGGDFAATLREMVGTVTQAQQAATEAARAYASGRTTDVASTMVVMERANLTLQLVLQVRNRLLEAYQEIQRIQV